MDRVFIELKSALLDKKQQLNNRLDGIETTVRHAGEPLEKDSEEQAVQLQNDEVLDALDDAGRKELLQIESALARLEQNIYDVCVSCGGKISIERLMAIPYTDKCIKCAGK